MTKTNQTPPTLFPDADALQHARAAWHVAHTKSRFEKAFAHDLMAMGIPYFLPLIRKVIVSGGRKRQSLVPLFPGYVFFSGEEDARYRSMTTGRLCQTLEVADQRQLINELLVVSRALEGRAELDPYPYAAIGRRCRIKAGVFRGMEGIVITRGKSARLVLQVSILGQGASMEIEPDLLEPCD